MPTPSFPSEDLANEDLSIEDDSRLFPRLTSMSGDEKESRMMEAKIWKLYREYETCLKEALTPGINPEAMLCLLKRAEETLHTRIWYADKIISKIDSRGFWRRRINYWRSDMRERCEKHRKECLEDLKILKETIGKISFALKINSAHKSYSDALEKMKLAYAQDQGWLRSFVSPEEALEKLSQTLELYEQARQLALESKSTLRLFYAERHRDVVVVQEAIDICDESIKVITQERKDKEEFILLTTESLEKKFVQRKEKSDEFLQDGFHHQSYELDKKRLFVAQRLIESDSKIDENLLKEEIEGLEKKIEVYEKQSDQSRLTAIKKASDLQQLKKEEKVKREAFFQEQISIARALAHSLLKYGALPKAFPLYDTPFEDKGVFMLYTGQHYPFLFQSEKPFTSFFIKVFDGKELIHKEKITLPSKEKYLTKNKALYIPDTVLQRELGVELRLQVVCDIKQAFSMLMSVKAINENHRLVISMEEEKPLLQTGFLSPPPWQLQMLAKPCLPKAGCLALLDAGGSSFKCTQALKQPSNKGNQVRFEELDQLVEELGSDPLLIAQYVQNEIAFSEPFMTQEEGVFLAPSVQRSPLRTFIDKRGSPAEQCELLVYLLRQSGCHAGYVVGKRSAVAKQVMENMLLTKLPDKEEQAHVNYPWVVLLTPDNEPVSLFPWIKEIQVTQGHDLYSLLPGKYGNADRWLEHYLKRDPAIFRHVGKENNDTVVNLFVRFVQEKLREQGLCLEDVGLQQVPIKKQYTSWQEFPRAVCQKHGPVVSSLKQALPESFLQMTIFSRENPEKRITRTIYPSEITHLTHKVAFIYKGWRWYKLMFDGEEVLSLDDTDHVVDFELCYVVPYGTNGKEHRQVRTASIGRGTKAVLCFHFEGASPLITQKRLMDFVQASDDTEKLYNLLSFMGAAYFDRCGYAEEYLAKIHKMQPVSTFGFGFVKLVPDHDKAVLAQVDMCHMSAPISSVPDLTGVQESKSVLRQRLDTILIADQSSNEHRVLQEVFSDSFAVSTVRLLQQAHIQEQRQSVPGGGFLLVTPEIMREANKNPELAQILYFSNLRDFNLREFKETSQYWKMLESWLNSDSPFDEWSYAYLTPGKIVNEDESYEELGALILRPYGYRAYISSKGLVLNGGCVTLDSGFDASDITALRDYYSQMSCSNMWVTSVFGVKQYHSPIKFQVNPYFSSPDFSDYSGFSDTNVPKRGEFAPRMNPNHRIDYPVNETPSLRSDGFGVGSGRIQPPACGPVYHKPFQVASSVQEEVDKFFSSDIRPKNKSFLSNVADPVDTITGAFYIDEVDLSLPGPFPLIIRRNYNSQRPILGQLGHGWKFSLNPFLVEQEGKLYAAEMDGTVVCYRYNDETERFEVFAEDNLDLYNFNSSGQGGTSSLFHSYIKDDVLYGADGSLRFFEEGELKKWVNSAGASLSFHYEDGHLVKIEGENGNFCKLCYNGQGQVGEIYTKDGVSVKYSYNNLAELTQVTLPNTAVIMYEYDRKHRVLRETKPHGVVVENIYDDRGRVIEQRSPMGPQQSMIVTAQFEYSDGCTKVMDSAGSVTTYHTFEGQIYKVVDPLGGVTLQSWFIDDSSWLNAETGRVEPFEGEGAFLRSLKSYVDKRGLTTHYQYDCRGNPEVVELQGEDLTGSGQSRITQRFSYNQNNLVTTKQVKEHIQETIYDEKFPFLPAEVKHFSGDTLVNVTRFEYDDKGHLVYQDVDGSITLWEYNCQGLPSKKVEKTGTNDPDVVHEYSYNARGLCTEIRGPSSVQKSCYDITGRVISVEEFSLGGALLDAKYLGYDLAGRVLWKQTANKNNTVYYDYHSSGNLKAVRQQLYPSGKIAFKIYEYDSLGYVIEEVDPRGYCTYRDYDALGHVISETKEGHTQRFSYEKGGLISSKISPGGGQTRFTYTTNGLIKEHEFADGTTKRLAYDEMGRVVRETDQNGTWETVYNDAERKVVRNHVETGVKETQTLDTGGRVIAATDPAGYTVTREYDDLGRLILEKDALGEVTHWNYYQTQVVCTRPNGEKQIQVFAGSHLIEEKLLDSCGEILDGKYIIYTPEEDKKEVIHGDTAEVTWNNVLGQPVRVEEGGKITTYSYDRCGNCRAVYDGQSRSVKKEYDGLGRVISKKLGDGSSFEFVYDLDSNLAEYCLPSGAIWKAEYDKAGRKVSEKVEYDGESFKNWSYEYEKGRLKNAYDPMGRFWLYAYDEMGLMVQEKVGDWQCDYEYDERGLLTSIEQTGPPESSSWMMSWFETKQPRRSRVEREYDEKGSVIHEAIYLDGECVQETKQTWTASSRILEIGDHFREMVYSGGHLSSINADGHAFNYSYDQAGKLKGRDLPGVASYLTYSNEGMLEEVTTTLPGQCLQEQFSWDLSGKLTYYSKAGEGKAFSYNERGFLKVAGSEEYAFDFDEQGTGVRTHGPSDELTSLDDFGRALEGQSRSNYRTEYDPMGNVVRVGSKKMQWDPWGRLLAVRDQGYDWSASYDPMGRRIQTKYTADGEDLVVTTSLFDPEVEFEEIGSLIDGALYWKVHGPGACDGVLDETGALVVLVHSCLRELEGALYEGAFHRSEEELTVYGPTDKPKVPRDVLAYAMALSWHSKSVDMTGLIVMGMRHYDPLTGRFLSPDPVDYPTCVDLYAYTVGDPVNYMDLDGRFSSPAYKNTAPSHAGFSDFNPWTGGFVTAVNQITPHLSSLGLSRSQSYQIEGFDLPKGQISFINGINNSKKDSMGGARFISGLGNGVKVNGIYNASNGFLLDVAECMTGHTGIRAPTAELFRNHYTDLALKYGSDANFLHFCHSGGAIPTKQGLELLPPSIRNQITVVAIAPAVIIPEELCYQSFNYVSKRDFVTHLDLMGKVRYGDQLEMLDPHPNAGFFDHSLQSPTFKKLIDLHVNGYIKSHGGL